MLSTHLQIGIRSANANDGLANRKRFKYRLHVRAIGEHWQMFVAQYVDSQKADHLPRWRAAILGNNPNLIQNRHDLAITVFTAAVASLSSERRPQTII